MEMSIWNGPYGSTLGAGKCETIVSKSGVRSPPVAPESCDVLAPELPGLFARYRGNLRMCLREIYDWLAVGVQPSGC